MAAGFFIFTTFTLGVWQTCPWILAKLLSTIATRQSMTSGFLLSYFYTGSLANLLLESGKHALNYKTSR